MAVPFNRELIRGAFGPAPPARRRRPRPRTLGTMADARVNMLMRPEEERIKRRTTQDLASLGAAGAAAAQLLLGVAPRTQEGYDKAAQTIGGLSSGFTGDMAARIKAAQEASAKFAAQQGTTATPSVDADKLQDTVHYLGGYLGGSDLAAQGAHARAFAETLPGLQAMRTTEDIRGRQRMGEEELLELAAKRPELRAQIEEELHKRELDRLEYDLRLRAQKLYEVKAGEDIRHNKATESAANRRARIAEKNYNLAIQRHELAVSKAEAEGRKVNASASKGLGHLVDQYGDPILDANGKKIKIKGDAATKTPWQQHRAEAVETGRELRGEPVETMDPLSFEGRYLSSKNRGKGVIKGRAGRPATTNDPKLAKRDGEYTFREAQDYLVQTYGISKANARKALIAAGWRPDGKRPKPKSNKTRIQ